ncbi:MAG TPA: 4-hydroxy-tetrahydrodipicolinate synthase [Balneolaceae bacterium]|nr:4-hydroxy-tetrahydrodipicolinate synthase [Balneolaceae bacterium]
MMKDKRLWTALITPMKEDGRIDYKSLEYLIRIQEKAGNGILLIGSTGEGLALSDKEKRDVVEFSSSLDPDVPLMVGVGGMNAAIQESWIHHCNSLNVDAFLLVTPLYAKPGPKGQTAWFKRLLNASDKPCMIYNIPSRTGIDLTTEVVEALKQHPNFWSIKEASGKLSSYQQFRRRAPETPLFSGDDALVAFFKPAGCAGLVSVAANVWPEETALYVEKSLSGDTESLFPLWNRAIEVLFSASNPIPVKLLLHHKGDIGSPELKLPLVKEELDDISELIAIDEEIRTWYKNNI